MKARLSSSTPVVLIAALAMGTTLSVREARGAPAGNPVLVVPVSGKLLGATESVSLSGEARIRTSIVKDGEFGDPPSVVISVNLKDVTGSGSAGTKYEASGEQDLVRPLIESDTVEVVFSVYPAGTDASNSKAIPATARFALSLDGKTGAVLKADATIAAVGQSN